MLMAIVVECCNAKLLMTKITLKTQLTLFYGLLVYLREALKKKP